MYVRKRMLKHLNKLILFGVLFIQSFRKLLLLFSFCALHNIIELFRQKYDLHKTRTVFVVKDRARFATFSHGILTLLLQDRFWKTTVKLNYLSENYFCHISCSTDKVRPVVTTSSWQSNFPALPITKMVEDSYFRQRSKSELTIKKSWNKKTFETSLVGNVLMFGI